MNELQGKIVINSFLTQYQKVNARSIDENLFFKSILRANYTKEKFLSTLGSAFKISELDYSELDELMLNLAEKTRGALPDTGSFFRAISEGTEAKFSTVSIIKNAVIEGAKEGGNIITDFSENSLSVVKQATWFIPLMIVVGVGAFLYVNYKKVIRA